MDKPEPIPALTGLRFVAAFSVLIGHSADWIRIFDPPANFTGLFSWGPAIGMPLFFVLSGFVIHYNYGEQFANGFVKPTLNFFIARFARLYPLYIFCLLFDIVHKNAWGLVFDGAYTGYLPRFLLLWQAWGVEYYGPTWTGHLLLPMAWSISVEVFFYALYPCFARLILRIPTATRAAQIYAAIAVCFYAGIAFCFLNYDTLRIWGNETFSINADPQNALLGWLLNTGPVGRFWEFLMGAVVAQAIHRLRHTPPGKIEARLGSGILTALVILVGVLFIYGPRNSFLLFAGSYPGGFAPILAAFMFCCARYKSLITAALASSGLVALGDASYSIYLLHGFTLQLFIPANPTFVLSVVGVTVWVVTVTVAIVFTFMASLGSYRMLEVPARRYLRRVLPPLLRIVPADFADALGARTIAGIALMCIIGSMIAWNWPPSFGPIDIVEASYGANCKPSTPTIVNTFHPGNATVETRKICRGSLNCDFVIDVNRFGDTMNGCLKDYTVIFHCPGNALLQTASIAGEAHGKKVTLACDRSN